MMTAYHTCRRSQISAGGVLVFPPGVIMPLRATLEAADLVTPARFASQVPGLTANQVSTWIRRSEGILGRKVEPLGRLGPYETYDWNDLAALEREMHRRQQAREGARAA
jgi:hypothetical protein